MELDSTRLFWVKGESDCSLIIDGDIGIDGAFRGQVHGYLPEDWLPTMLDWFPAEMESGAVVYTFVRDDALAAMIDAGIEVGQTGPVASFVESGVSGGEWPHSERYRYIIAEVGVEGHLTDPNPGDKLKLPMCVDGRTWNQIEFVLASGISRAKFCSSALVKLARKLRWEGIVFWLIEDKGDEISSRADGCVTMRINFNAKVPEWPPTGLEHCLG